MKKHEHDVGSTIEFAHLSIILRFRSIIVRYEQTGLCASVAISGMEDTGIKFCHVAKSHYCSFKDFPQCATVSGGQSDSG